MRWLIWSNEHQGWWRPNSRGYTTRCWEAGRYSFKEAEHIVRNANQHLSLDAPPNEIMVPGTPPAEIEERMKG